MKGDRFEVDKIECTGILSVDGEVNADNIISEGIIKAHEVYGDYVEINSIRKSKFGLLFFTLH